MKKLRIRELIITNYYKNAKRRTSIPNFFACTRIGDTESLSRH